MAENKESAVLKFARDAVLTIVSGIVLEPTLKQIHFDVGPYLRQLWLGIAMFLTLDYITRKHVGRLIQWKKSLTRRKRVMSYFLVSIICVVVGCAYYNFTEQSNPVRQQPPRSAWGVLPRFDGAIWPP
jgi:hypothetical protein